MEGIVTSSQRAAFYSKGYNPFYRVRACLYTFRSGFDIILPNTLYTRLHITPNGIYPLLQP
jgi:hypothetical protein